MIKNIFMLGLMIFLLSCKESKTPTSTQNQIIESNALSDDDLEKSIRRMVRAMNEYNVPAIESLRDSVTPAHIDVLLPLWDIELNWKTKDGFTFLMCDQIDPRLKPMMQEALNSPLEDSQAYGLCYLQGKDCNFNSMLDQYGRFSKEAINQQIKALKN